MSTNNPKTVASLSIALSILALVFTGCNSSSGANPTGGTPTAPAQAPDLGPLVAPAPVAVPAAVPTTPVSAGLSVISTTSNLTVANGSVVPFTTVSITSAGQFQLVLEEADNWGISQWYDLVNDPGMTTNLTGPGMGSGGGCAMCAEPGLFQQVFYGSTPDDVKAFSRAIFYFPNTPRSMVISENTSVRVVITTSSHPMVNAQGVDTNITITMTYTIYPNGKIYVTSNVAMAAAQAIAEWRMAVLGLTRPDHDSRHGFNSA